MVQISNDCRSITLKHSLTCTKWWPTKIQPGDHLFLSRHLAVTTLDCWRLLKTSEENSKMLRSYTTVSEINFSRQVPTGDWNFFSSCQMWLPKSEYKNAKFFKTFLWVKIFLLLNDRKSQIPRVKALKYRVAYNLVEMEFFRQIDRSLNITSFSSYIPSVWSLPEATHEASGCSKGKHVFLPCAHGMAGSWNRWWH